MPAKKRRKKTRKKTRKYSRRRFRVVVSLLTLATILLFVAAATTIYHTLRFTQLVDRKLAGEAEQQLASVYARPFELRRGQRLGDDELVSVLNDLGYRQAATLGDEPGSFALEESAIEVRPRGALRAPIRVRLEDDHVVAIEEQRSGAPLDIVQLPSVRVTTLFDDDRAKRRWVPLEEIPEHVRGAVLATEDRRFYDHTGFDPVGIARALVNDIRQGDLSQGGSTLTQQLVKNYFLTPERTVRRKVLEAYLAVLLESRTSKDDILELYLNDVYLGQRGSFGIHGVEQASQIFFGKTVGNVSAAEAALIAATIRSPNSSSPFRHPERSRERRDVVLRQMAEAGYLEEGDVAAATAEPLGLVSGTVDRGEAPGFVDALRRELLESHEPLQLQTRGLSVHSTMDRYLQNRAQQAVVEGLAEIRDQLPEGAGLPQAALVAIAPSTGDVLALVGSRSYGTSQYNRATHARRQPGSAFKPFVYLAVFEHDANAAPADTVVDEPTTFRQGGRAWRPNNYTRRFEGRVSYRRALALSLNVATARVGQTVGFERVVELWETMGMASRLEPYPSLVLGAFELTPLELATAYAVLANGGRRVEPRFYSRLDDSAGKVIEERAIESHRVASAESTYLVTDMLRSVIAYGTARGARARGFRAEAAGKTGTTNDTRDAWFVGYTPDVLTVVWVGYDDNRELGLSGSQAALPIWTRFMKAAVSGRESARFAPPPGVVHVAFDPATGKRARDACPGGYREAYRRGTEPTELCSVH